MQLSTTLVSPPFFNRFRPPAMEIFRLQSEADNAQKLMINGRKTSEVRITGEPPQRRRIRERGPAERARVCAFLEIRTTLDALKKRQLQLQKQLEEADYFQAQMSKDGRRDGGIFSRVQSRINAQICSVTSRENPQHHERAQGGGCRRAGIRNEPNQQ